MTETNSTERRLKELETLLAEWGMSIVVVAIGRKHGTVSVIDEFLPLSHYADWALQEKE